MAWRGNAVSELWLALLAVTLLVFGSTEADAAYRLVFQNGTSVEVRSYEDLGDSLRYPRFNGTVTVPKANLSSIQEVPAAPPNPSPATTPQLPPIPAPLSQTRQSPSVEASPPAAVRPAPAPVKPIPLAPIDFTAGARNVIGSFVAVCFLVLLAVAGLVGLRRFLPMILGKEEKDSTLPYEKRRSLLTAAERSFYGVLCQAVDHQYAIFAKVRLGDLLEIPWGTSKFRLHLSRINRKHVDFVLCEATSFTPLLVIELDDSSHDREDRQERDAFVDAALQAAGLPILHISAEHAYAPAELRVQVYGHLNAGAQAEVSA